MKICMLILLLTCVFWASTNADVQNSEQVNRFKLVSQRIRSLRDSLGVKLPADSKTPKPVAPERAEEVEDQWDFGSLFGQFSTKVGAVVKNVVGDLLGCVDNIFKCLRPGEDKKDNKKQKKNKGEPGTAGETAKPTPTVRTTEKLTEATTMPTVPVVGVANILKGEVAAGKPALISVAEKVDPSKVDKMKPNEAIVDKP